MSEKTLNFDKVKINKNKFNASKQPIDVNLVDVHKKVTTYEIKHGDQRFKYYILKLPQMTGFIKYFYNGGKNMSFVVKDDSVLIKYSEIWNKMKELTGKQLQRYKNQGKDI